MKYTIFLFLFVFPSFIFSQTEAEQIKNFISTDDLGAFLEFLEDGNDLDDCYEIRDSKYSLLTLSIKFNCKKIFKKCLELEAELNQSCTEKTPLIYAIKYQREYFFKKLVIAGADKSIETPEGKTAMQYAVKYKRKEFISLLK
ncbi:MAG: ankyrin repeat domain-containing protein [Saprospiraceae bacterium]